MSGGEESGLGCDIIIQILKLHLWLFSVTISYLKKKETNLCVIVQFTNDLIKSFIYISLQVEITI